MEMLKVEDLIDIEKAREIFAKIPKERIMKWMAISKSGRITIERLKPYEEMTQVDWLENELLAGRKVSPLDALRDFGVFRLAAVVHKLKNRGMHILSHRQQHGKRKDCYYSVYYLAKEERERVKNLQENGATRYD